MDAGYTWFAMSIDRFIFLLIGAGIGFMVGTVFAVIGGDGMRNFLPILWTGLLITAGFILGTYASRLLK